MLAVTTPRSDISHDSDDGTSGMPEQEYEAARNRLPGRADSVRPPFRQTPAW